MTLARSVANGIATASFIAPSQAFDDDPPVGVDAAAHLNIVAGARVLVESRPGSDDELEIVEPAGRRQAAVQTHARADLDRGGDAALLPQHDARPLIGLGLAPEEAPLREQSVPDA